MWNLTTFQLIQHIHTIVIFNFCIGCLIELKFCKVPRNSFSNRCWNFFRSLSISKQNSFVYWPNFQWRFWCPCLQNCSPGSSLLNYYAFNLKKMTGEMYSPKKFMRRTCKTICTDWLHCSPGFCPSHYCQPPRFKKYLLTEYLYLHPGRGASEKRSAVGFCLGSGLFGSYNSD